MISVVIPAYNREKTITRAINSVLNQTYKDLELIIVDDNSTDGTEKAVKAVKDSRINYYKLEENKGACFARNFGASKANGEYIAFQDSDDEWLANKLELQMSEMKKNNADMVFARLKLYEEDIPNKCVRSAPRENKKSGVITYEELLSKTLVTTPTILIKKQIFDEIKFDEEMPRFQDWEFSLRVAKKYKVYYIAKDVMKAYRQNNSITNQNNKGVIALNRLYIKNKEAFEENKKAYANLQILLGECYAKNKQDYKEYLKKSLKTKFTIINLLRIIKIIYKNR